MSSFKWPTHVKDHRGKLYRVKDVKLTQVANVLMGGYMLDACIIVDLEPDPSPPEDAVTMDWPNPAPEPQFYGLGVVHLLSKPDDPQ